jgi:hypothetical protein
MININLFGEEYKRISALVQKYIEKETSIQLPKIYKKDVFIISELNDDDRKVEIMCCVLHPTEEDFITFREKDGTCNSLCFCFVQYYNDVVTPLKYYDGTLDKYTTNLIGKMFIDVNMFICSYYKLEMYLNLNGY